MYGLLAVRIALGMGEMHMYLAPIAYILCTYCICTLHLLHIYLLYKYA